MKKLYLVDCSSIFFRAFYAIRSLTNSKGMPTNALYGYLATMIKLLKDLSPDDAVAVCYDRPEPSFREGIAESYKANRDECPEDLAKQIPFIKDLNEAMNLRGFEMPGYEADDIIGTLTHLGLKWGYEIMIVSGDKDFGQLLGPHVKLVDLGKEVTYDEKKFQEKWGIKPCQMIDYLAIVGDTSDNIPGVKGIGPKGAERLLAEWESLDGIYKNIELIKNERTRNLLMESKEQAYLAKRLVTICTDIKLPVKADDLTYRDVNRETLGPLLQELEFKSFHAKLVGGEAQVGGPPKTAEAASGSKPGAEGASSTKKAAASVAPLPTPTVPSRLEVTSQTAELSEIFSTEPVIWLDASPAGLAIGGKEVIYKFEGNDEDLVSWVQTQARAGKSLAGIGLKDQLHLLKFQSGDASLRIEFDPALEAYLLEPGQDVSFEALSMKYLAKAAPDFINPAERLQDVYRLHQVFQGELEEKGLVKLLQKLELPLVGVLFEMEEKGVKLDIRKLGELSKKLSAEIKKLEAKIHELTESDFNIGSPKQMGMVLFDKLKLPVIRKTKTGYSTDSDVLEALKSRHPVAEVILDWRELNKIRGTYVDALPKLVDSKTGRLHTSFNQAVTTTGRLSSTNPNLQNIPIRTDLGRQIRQMFIPEKGRQIVSADYSQIELRILAHIANDRPLIEAFEKDRDIHSATASEVFEVPFEQVTSEHRRLAKAINFGIAYGMSAFGLADRLGIDRKKAQDIIGRYMSRYPGVARYMQETVEVAVQRGYVGTLFGRRRYLKDITSSNRHTRQAAERAAINMPIQGTAADIMKKSMMEVAGKISGRSDVVMLLQVHDELVFEVDKEKCEEVMPVIRSAMENTVKLKVPLKVSIGAGANWDEAH